MDEINTLSSELGTVLGLTLNRLTALHEKVDKVGVDTAAPRASVERLEGVFTSELAPAIAATNQRSKFQPEPGARVPGAAHLELQRETARGNFGAVWAARDTA